MHWGAAIPGAPAEAERPDCADARARGERAVALEDAPIVARGPAGPEENPEAAPREREPTRHRPRSVDAVAVGVDVIDGEDVAAAAEGAAPEGGIAGFP